MTVEDHQRIYFGTTLHTHHEILLQSILRENLPLPTTIKSSFRTNDMMLKSVPLASVGNTAIIDFFHDDNCQHMANQAFNIWDNTCATHTGGFQSYRITVAGGRNQRISSFSHNGCYELYEKDVTDCSAAGDLGTCHKATNEWGGSNAVGSAVMCGAWHQ